MAEAGNISIEIELTFLAKYLPKEIATLEPDEMIDAYVPQQYGRPHLRIRKRGDSYEITKKLRIEGKGFSEHTEQTITLDEVQFKTLTKNPSLLVVKKRRYSATIEGYAAEVDVFDGELGGLVIIDFEFENAQTRDAFIAPDCCLANVTEEQFIAGGRLAGKSYKGIEADLLRFGYQKIIV